MASQQDTRKQEEHVERKEEQAMSPEDIGHYRATAQQNSIETIWAAEERYEKAKQSGAASLKETKEAIVHGLGATTAYVAGKAVEVKETATHGAHVAVEYTKEKGAVAKDVALEKSSEGVSMAKDSLQSAAQKAAECTQLAVVKAKDIAVSTGKTAAEYIREKALGAKETTDASEKAKEYTGQKAEELKGEAKQYTGQKGEAQEEEAVDSTGQAGEYAGEKHKQELKEETHETGENLRDLSVRSEVAEHKTPDQLNAEEAVDQTTNTEKAATADAGEILEAVGEAVIGVAKTAKDLVTGHEISQKKE